MKPATFTHAAPSAKAGKFDELTQSERGQGTQHLEPLPVKSRGFFAQLRPPMSAEVKSVYYVNQGVEDRLTALGIRMQTLTDEGMRATLRVEGDVPE